MKIVFFAHPTFLGSQSMPRFVNMLAKGMQERGHEVKIWSPEAFFSKLPVPKLKKWLGYMDQYLVFPWAVKRKIKLESEDTIYVMSDHALGPYVPIIAHLPHAIHCHDFLAQRSALGQIPENRTSSSGQKYQAYIRKGYSVGRNFISVSEKTRTDLEEFLSVKPEVSEMVYNGLNPNFQPMSVEGARTELSVKLGLDLSAGYILHVGGNQWYKNRVGVVAIYDQWRKQFETDLPLLLIGQSPSAALREAIEASSYKQDIHCFSDISDEHVKLAYAGATVFLFPSIAEGFGWPIAEGMASGTVVVTTDEAPMLEVAGDAAFLLHRRPSDQNRLTEWAKEAAVILNRAVTLEEPERAIVIKRGLINVSKFKLENALDRIEQIYKQVLNK